MLLVVGIFADGDGFRRSTRVGVDDNRCLRTSHFRGGNTDVAVVLPFEFETCGLDIHARHGPVETAQRCSGWNLKTTICLTETSILAVSSQRVAGTELRKYPKRLPKKVLNSAAAQT